MAVNEFNATRQQLANTLNTVSDQFCEGAQYREYIAVYTCVQSVDATDLQMETRRHHDCVLGSAELLVYEA